MNESIEEMHNRMMDMDPSDPELPQLKKTLQVCREMTHAVEEGFVEIEEVENEDVPGGIEYLFFPKSDGVHGPPIEA